MASTTSLLDQAVLLTKDLLKALAEGDSFSNVIEESFGDRFKSEQAEAIRQSWSTGDFTQLPIIQIESGSVLRGANGAYATQTNQIYLSQDYLEASADNPDAIAAVLLEEIGHFVDSQINTSDSPGDEGAVFSALVRGENLDLLQLQRLKLEDDGALTTLAGQTLQIEQNNLAITSLSSGSEATFYLDPSSPYVREVNVGFSWNNSSGSPVFIFAQGLFNGNSVGFTTGSQLYDNDDSKLNNLGSSLTVLPRSGLRPGNLSIAVRDFENKPVIISVPFSGYSLGRTTPGEINSIRLYMQQTDFNGSYFGSILNEVTIPVNYLFVGDMDLGVTKLDVPNSAQVGQPFTYKIQITNNGPFNAENVLLTEILPKGLKYVPSLFNFYPIEVSKVGDTTELKISISNVSRFSPTTFSLTVVPTEESRPEASDPLIPEWTINTSTSVGTQSRAFNDTNLANNAVIQSFQVVSGNRPPVAGNDNFNTDEDVSLNTGDVLSNDIDPDNNVPLTAAIVSQPKNGILTLNSNGAFTYQPKKDFNGSDSFTYIAKDSLGAASQPATVILTINPINDPPVAKDDDYTLTLNTSNSINILTNDVDVDGDELSAQVVTAPKEGTLTKEADGSLTYTPNEVLSGLDYFTYTVDDGNGGVSAPATVIVSIPQPEPLRIKGRYEQLAEGSYKVSGEVQVGLINKQIPFPFDPLITIRDGSLQYDQQTIQANGVVFANIGNITAPLFAGNFDINTGQTTTTFLEDNKLNTSEFQLAGLNVDFNKLDFQAGKISLQGVVTLPQILGGASVDINGTNWLLIEQDGISLTGGQVQVSATGLKFANLFEVQSSDLLLEYQKQPEALKIQGQAQISIPLLRNAKGTADFSASDKYILIKPDPSEPNGVDIDAVGKLSLENLTIIPNVWELKQASLALDTVAGQFGGSAQLLLPFGLEIGSKFDFVEETLNKWELKRFLVEASGLNISLPVFPLVSLQGIKGDVSGLSNNTSELSFDGSVKFTAGPQIPISLPSWLGGRNLNGSLFELDVNGKIDQTRLYASGQFNLGGGFLSSTGTITTELNWEKDSLYISGGFTALDGLVNGNGGFTANANMDFTMQSGVSLRLPNYGVFQTFNLAGRTIAEADALVQYRNDSTLTNDFIQASGSLLGLTAGIRVYFDGNADLIGAKEIEQAQQQAEGSIPSIARLDNTNLSNLDASALSGIAQQSWLLAKSDLQELSTSPNFALIFDTAFGSACNWEAATAIQQSWLVGDFSSLPKIEIVSTSNINNANAAYANSIGTIYLAKEFLAENQANLETIAGVLLEEIGHWVDTHVNTADSLGDEGAIFSSLVRSETLTEHQLQLLKAEDDTVTVTLNGSVTQLNLNSFQIAQAAYDVGANTPWLLLSADWENDIGRPSIQLRAPDGTIYTEADISNTANIRIDEELSDATHLIIAVNQPAAGNWNLKLLSNTDPGRIDFAALGGTNAPTVTITSLNQNSNSQSITINYDAFDTDSQAKISFFYDADQNNFDGLLITDGVAETNGSSSYVWNPVGVAPGDYYIYAVAQDENSFPAFSYAPYKVTISGPTPSLAISNLNFLEGNTGVTNAIVTVSLSEASTQTVNVDYYTSDGSAVFDTDYVVTNGNLIFNPGEMSKAIIIAINGDTNFELDEAFIVNLSGATNATIANAQGIVTITNDDPLATATSLPDLDTVEDGVFNFTVTGNTFNVDASINLTYTATLSNGDSLPDWLSFDPTTRTFSGTPTNDNVGILSVKVTATASAGTSTSDTFDLMIANTNDAPTIANEIADQTAQKGLPFNFTIPANTFSDIDAGDTLTYIATFSNGNPLPTWLSFNPTTRAFSGTPPANTGSNLNITVTATDQVGTFVSDTFDLTVLNVPPVLDLNGSAAGTNFAATFTEDKGAIAVVSSGLTLTDVDNTTVTSATITISNLLDGSTEFLSVPNTFGYMSATYDSSTGTLQLTGTATLAQYQQVLRTLRYNNTSQNPNPTPRQISFVVNDGAADSVITTSTITITPVNDAPVLDLNGSASGINFSTTFTEDGGLTEIVSNLSLSDVDSSSITSATIRIRNLIDPGAEFLSVNTADTQITATYDVTAGILELRGTDTIANYQQVLRTVAYNNISQNPTTTARLIDFAASDGVASSVNATATVRVVSVNDLPMIALAGDSATYVENSASVVIDDGITLSDADSSTLQKATVRITNFVSGQDSLSFTPFGNITGSFSAGVLTLTGIASLEDYQTVLRSVTYSNSSDRPSATPRTIDFVVNDGKSNSLAARSTVAIAPMNDAPVLNVSGVKNFTAINEDPTTNAGTLVSTLLGSAVSDLDAGALRGIAVTDALGSGFWQYSTDSGSNWSNFSSVSETNALLLAADTRIRFSPELNFNGTVNLSYRAWDQTSGTLGLQLDTSINGGITAFSTAIATSSLTVNPVNDAPVNTVPDTQAIDEDTFLIFSSANGNPIIISDLEAGSNPVRLTLTTGNGTLQLSSLSGLTTVTGNGTTSVTATGTLSNLNDALNGLRFNPTANFNGIANLSVTTNDLGNSGSGGARSDSDRISITINPVNDVPVNLLPTRAQTVRQGSSLIFSSTSGNRISISDVDAGTGIEQINLSVSDGILALGSTDGLIVVEGNNTNNLSIQGTLPTLNIALNGLRFTPDLFSVAAGAVTLTINTNDLNSTGSGGVQTDADSLSITVTPANPITGTSSNNNLSGSSVDNLIRGLGGNDTLYGNGGNDILLGGDGNDVIYSAAGDDLINGGLGDDSIWLGGGHDTIVLARGNGVDTIYNYPSGSTRFKLDAGLAFNDLTIVQSGSSTLIATTSGEQLASLMWTQLSSITSNNFF